MVYVLNEWVERLLFDFSASTGVGTGCSTYHPMLAAIYARNVHTRRALVQTTMQGRTTLPEFGKLRAGRELRTPQVGDLIGLFGLVGTG